MKRGEGRKENGMKARSTSRGRRVKKRTERKGAEQGEEGRKK